jgi:hypothetical protein
MNKTIYLRDEEGPIWEQARTLAGDKLSPVIVTALKQFIDAAEASRKGFSRIEIEYKDAADHSIPKKKAFYGRWIFPPSEPLTEDHGSREVRYAVASTARGNFVFFSWHEYYEERGEHGHTFEVYPSLEAAAAVQRVNGAATKAIEAIGIPVEELDI